jgi:CRISPR system Cascade subunit CasB
MEITNVTTPTPASAQAAARGRERRYLGDVVSEVAGTYITELQQGYCRDASAAVALLAQLRRGAGKLPADVPELWGITGTERLFQAEPRLATDEIGASRAEAALFLALTLYAAHQQSRPERGMHQPGIGFGAAVRRLMGTEIDEPIRQRFIRIGTASTLPTLAYRLREMITLLRRESIPFDYAELAGQLYRVRVPGGLADVRQVWGRDFHAWRPSANGDGSRTDAPNLSAPSDDEMTTGQDTP